MSKMIFPYKADEFAAICGQAPYALYFYARLGQYIPPEKDHPWFEYFKGEGILFPDKCVTFEASGYSAGKLRQYAIDQKLFAIQTHCDNSVDYGHYGTGPGGFRIYHPRFPKGSILTPYAGNAHEHMLLLTPAITCFYQGEKASEEYATTPLLGWNSVSRLTKQELLPSLQKLFMEITLLCRDQELRPWKDQLLILRTIQKMVDIFTAFHSLPESDREADKAVMANLIEDLWCYVLPKTTYGITSHHASQTKHIPHPSRAVAISPLIRGLGLDFLVHQTNRLERVYYDIR